MKSVLITGATSGIGKETALLFGKNGFLVYCHGKSEISDFSVVDEIIQNRGKAKKLVADFLKEEEIKAMFEEILSLDVLVNNAGFVSRTKPIPSENFRKTLKINLVAPYLCSELAKTKGISALVNVGSMRGISTCATTPDYSASKAGLHNLTISLARNFAPSIRVNAVAPGFVKTALHEGMEERLDRERNMTPLQRIGSPSEVAEVIFFLASEKASFVTGQIVGVDGGRSFFVG